MIWESQASSNVRKLVNDILKEFGLVLDLSSFIVYDNENKMKSTSHDMNQIGCSVNYLNKILEKIFFDTKITELNQV